MNNEPKEANFEDVTPNPEFLIKSISEQGYSFEAAIADLIDNSISADADKVEILIDTDTEPFTLFLADNGKGMDETQLKNCMRFPSQSPDVNRLDNDLGRFGLGMKTASFSQTRKFTTVSRPRASGLFSARTWDLELLKNNKWNLLVNSSEDVTNILEQYKCISCSRINSFSDFEANTIIIWEGLYKFEQYLEEKNREEALYKEIDIISEHLRLVFHRFMEKQDRKLQIRINNQLLTPFNPFPIKENDFRSLEFRKRKFGDDSIKIEGFILPSRSIKEAKQGLSIWTTKKRSLMDMEGIYIYRADRLILFGGWNGLIKKAPRLQLARLQVEIGNNADHLLHLNVAKSQVIIPHELKNAFQGYIDDLKLEAEKEFFNRGIRQFNEPKDSSNIHLFERRTSSKGPVLEINKDFELIKSLLCDLDKQQSSKLNMLLSMVNTRINKIRSTQVNQDFSVASDLTEEELIINIKDLVKRGVDSTTIQKFVIPELGFNVESLPEGVLELLKGVK
ncbi:ATP-binding protein [Colwellia sp. KU-HH00111]|uniref:ATP-binding protein n=1 Tax=Colwellia sp. KU-HH00111 TaxID=3127652 RepID=UPI003105C415